MEERPWTKSEFFAWSDGRRIVDLYELSKQLHCKQCRSLLDLGRTEREARYGLASVLYILCNCGVMNDVHTGRTQQDGGGSNSPSPMYEINIKASINLLMYGAGASRILSFLALLDIPVPPPDDTSLIVPVTEDADIQNASSALGLPPSSSTTTATAKSAPPAASAATSESTAPFQKPPPSSTAPSSFTPEPGFRSVPLPPRDDEDEDNDDALQEDIDNEDEDDENDMDDDDEEYMPTSKPKPRAKPKPAPAPKKKSLLRGPKSARAKQAAKLAAKKKAPVKLKVKIKKENVETPKKAADESEKQDDENVKQYVDPMDWSSSETETESVQGKNKGSDDSWHEDDYDGRDDEDVGSRPKRKRGRPKGSPEKGKRQRRSGSQKAKGESSSPKKTRVKAESKEVPRCTICNKDFTSAKGYNVHMKRVHNQEMKGVGPDGQPQMWSTVKEEKVTDCLYLCPSCNMVFSQGKCLTVHLKKTHPETEDFNDVDPHALSLEGTVLRLKRSWKDRETVRTCYKCLKCDVVMSQHRKFAMHIRIDDNKQITCEKFCPEGRSLSGYQRSLFLKGHKNYLCHTCGASFTEKSTFYNHIESHGETVSKRFTCQYCPYQCTRQRRMMNHTLSKHSTEPRPRPNVCEVCGKGFFNKNMLSRHIIDVHTGEKRFKCDLCPKTFLRRHKLLLHKNLHSGIRPFICSQCGQAFSVAYNLKVHQRLHTGEKPYKCQHCDAAFAQKNSLDVHMKKHGICTRKGTPTPRPRVNAYQTRRIPPSPPHLGSPPLQLVGSPPNLSSPQHQRMDSPPQPVDSPVQPRMDLHLHQRMEPQLRVDSHQRLDAHHRLDTHHQRLEAHQGLDLHQPMTAHQRMEYQQAARVDTESPQRPRVDPYMYPGYSGVVFPGVPGATYPFYQNM